MMKLIRCFFTIILLLLLLVVEGVEVLAVNRGFSTELLSEDDMNTLLKNIKFSLLVDEPPKKPIKCFDVNEDGAIAIGCSSSNNKTVCIYTNEGSFQYGYSFECSGDFGIELDVDFLKIYLVRSNIAVSINSAGEIKSVFKIQNTFENNAYWNDCVFSTKREIGDIEYILKNDMGILNVFASSYSQLVITNKDGEERVFYNVNLSQLLHMVIVVCGIIILICLVVSVVAWQFFKAKHNA